MGISLLLLCYGLSFLCFSRKHRALSTNKVLLIVNQAGLELTMIKGKMGLLPPFMLVCRLLPHLLTSILTFSIDKAADSLQRVDFKVSLAQKCWPLKPVGVGINGGPCGGCV